MSDTKTGERPLSFEEWLELEARSEERHEFHAGAVIAMGLGATKAHARIASAMECAIRAHVGRGAPCEVLNQSIAVRIEVLDKGLYPDLHVTCDSRDHESEGPTRFPVLIIEVLSPSTRDYDQGDKAEAYQRLVTLHEYVLIDTRVQRVVVYRRAGKDTWIKHGHYAAAVMSLESIGLDLQVASLYVGTRVPTHPRLVLSGPAPEAEND